MSVAEIQEVTLEHDQPTGGLWRDAFRRFRRNPAAIIGVAFVGFFVLIAIFAPLIAPHSPTDQDLSALANGCCPGPSRDHWFGLDELGRDEFSRVIYGARYSLVIGVVSVAVGLSIGMRARRRSPATSAAGPTRS